MRDYRPHRKARDLDALIDRAVCIGIVALLSLVVVLSVAKAAVAWWTGGVA